MEGVVGTHTGACPEEYARGNIDNDIRIKVLIIFNLRYFLVLGKFDFLMSGCFSYF